MRLKSVFTALAATDCNYHLKYFALFWAIILIVPLIYFPLPSVLFGHPWKVELVASLFLALTLTRYLFKSTSIKNLTVTSSQIVLWVITPWGLFIFWSATSVFWAGSVLSVLHHTLVWFCYLIFFLLAVLIVNSKKLLTLSIFFLTVVIGTITAICIIEFIFAMQITETFGFRYARFAEIYAAVLPLFFSFILRLRKKHLIWAVLITALVWIALLFSLSRGALLSTVVGLSFFILLRVLTCHTAVERKRLVLATAGIFLLTGLVQVPILRSNRLNIVDRLSIQTNEDPSNSLQKNIRFLFYGVGLEMFSNNLVNGIGADNFGLEFNKYRALFSAERKNQASAELQENKFPERAHNEYLQILAELGVVGAVFFLCFILGIIKLEIDIFKSERFLASNILNHAAIAGMIAFLCSSLFSSFSFRLMQNGLVFFFLLAIVLRKYLVKKRQENAIQFSALNCFNPVFVSVSIFLCLSLTIFSALKGTSQLLTYQAEREKDFEAASLYFERAEMLDSANAAANASLGFQLRGKNQFQASSVQLKKAVAKGLNTTGMYSYLISSQILANDFEGAEKTAAEAVNIFPYSISLRVRYSSLLKKRQMENESAKHYEIAKQIDKKQAETWWLLINEGGLVAVEKAKENNEILTLDKLYPDDAVLATISERQILYPEEQIKLQFSN